MLRPEILITIEFADNNTYPNRSGSASFRYVEELEVVSSWRLLGDTCKFKMPRGTGNGVSTIYAFDEQGNEYDYVKGIAALPSNQNSPNAWPLVMRGDRITVEAGYRYFTNEITVTTGSGINAPIEEKLESHVIFKGWVTRVINRVPIEIECMDDMWKFQQFFVPNKVYKITDTVESIVQDMLHQYNLQLSGLATPVYYKPAPSAVKTTTNSTFRTQNETLAQALDRLRKEVAFESWLRDVSGAVDPATGSSVPGVVTALHSSPIMYWPDNGDASESDKVVLQFQNNIITDDMQYTRKDDVNVGAVAYSFDSSQVLGKINKSNGKPPTKKARYEVFVGFQNGQFISKPIAVGTPPQSIAHSFNGEFKTYYFWNKKSSSDLINAATLQLRKFAYEGFRGNLTTFGLPRIKHGDQLTLQDLVLPERTGTYFVRAVNTTFGTNGFKQRVDIDLRIDGQGLNLADGV